MILNEKIDRLKIELLGSNNVDLFAYLYLRNQPKLNTLSADHIRGFENLISIKGYKGLFVNRNDLESIASKLPNPIYRKAINIFCLIGLALSNKNLFLPFINEEFYKLSNRYKYFISKYFPEEFKNSFIEGLNLIPKLNLSTFEKIAISIYLEDGKINLTNALEGYLKEEELDIIDLLLMEDFQSRKGLLYSKKQEKLLDDLIWIAQNIQSKHRIFNNDEDQFNSTFQSLLEAKGYDAKDQTQRGISGSQTNEGRYGELDILISDKGSGLHLSILEAFKLTSINSKEINKHLLKLSEAYDSNGLLYNYAVIYAKSADFSAMWERYLNFLPTIPFKYSLINTIDETTTYSQFSDFKIGRTTHQRNNVKVSVIHLFLNMNFPS